MIKSQKLRGQQKLKYFCQLCRKQCKDEHGWACHMNSHSHQGRMRQFAANPEQTIDKFSKQFETGFVEMLRDRYPNIRKKANELYVEFIDDRNHVHMNATKWDTLTTFCEHLKSYKNIAVEEREQIYLTYLEVDSREFKKTVEASKHVRDKSKEVDIEWKSLYEQIERTKAAETGRLKTIVQDEEKEPEVESLSFQINIPTVEVRKRNPIFSVESIEKEVAIEQHQPLYKKKCVNTEKLLNLIKPPEKHPWNVQKQEQKPQKQDSQEQDIPWIMKGIIVKILPHQIDPQFHNKKANVIGLASEFVARLQFNDMELEIDQTYLETVVPKEGSSVMVVVGKHRGQRAIIDRIYPDEGYAVLIFIKDGKQLSLNAACNEFSKLSE